VLVTGAVVLYSGVLQKGLDVLEENVKLKTQLEVQGKEITELRTKAQQLEQLRKLSKIGDLTAGDYWYYREIDPRAEKGRVLLIGLCPDHPCFRLKVGEQHQVEDGIAWDIVLDATGTTKSIGGTMRVGPGTTEHSFAQVTNEGMSMPLRLNLGEAIAMGAGDQVLTVRVIDARINSIPLAAMLRPKRPDEKGIELPFAEE
jgi:hypothetical protein